jgi:hypothetical protein
VASAANPYNHTWRLNTSGPNFADFVNAISERRVSGNHTFQGDVYLLKKESLQAGLKWEGKKWEFDPDYWVGRLDQNCDMVFDGTLPKDALLYLESSHKSMETQSLELSDGKQYDVHMGNVYYALGTDQTDEQAILSGNYRFAPSDDENMKRLDKSDPKVAEFLETIAGVDARKPGPNLAGYVDAVFGITDDGGHRRSTVYLLRKTRRPRA